MASKETEADKNDKNSPPTTAIPPTTTESSSSSSSSSSWWSNLVETAKGKSSAALEVMQTQSSAALEVMQKDLSEFTSVMANDTNELLGKAVPSVPKPMQSLMDGISYVLNDGQNENKPSTSTSTSNKDDQEEKKKNNKSKIKAKDTINTIQDRFNRDLKELQSNSSTFLIEVPNGDDDSSSSSSELEKQFADSQDKHKSEISSLMIENDAIRLIYAQLVPAQISNEIFWSRYFFKCEQLKKENEKRIKLLERTNDDGGINSKEEEDTLNWDDDDDEDEDKDKDCEKPKDKQKEEEESSNNQIASVSSEKLKLEEDSNSNEGKEVVVGEKEKEEVTKKVVEQYDESSSVETPNLSTKPKDLNLENRISQQQKTVDSKDDDWEKVSDSNSNEVVNETENTSTAAATEDKKGEEENVSKTSTAANPNPKENNRKNSNETEWDDWGE